MKIFNKLEINHIKINEKPDPSFQKYEYFCFFKCYLF